MLIDRLIGRLIVVCVVSLTGPVRCVCDAVSCHVSCVYQMVQLLHQLQLMSQAGGGGNMQLMQMLRGMDAPHHNGASKTTIDSLPTRIYTKKKSAAPTTTTTTTTAAAAAAPDTSTSATLAPAAAASGAGGTATSDTKSAPTDTKSSSPTNSDMNTCRVCLCEYEEGEELRTLPCFHSFHSACIDRWLGTDKRCPMCKNPL